MPICLNGNIEGGFYESDAIEVLLPVRINTLQVYSNFLQVLEHRGEYDQGLLDTDRFKCCGICCSVE